MAFCGGVWDRFGGSGYDKIGACIGVEIGDSSAACGCESKSKKSVAVEDDSRGCGDAAGGDAVSWAAEDDIDAAFAAVGVGGTDGKVIEAIVVEVAHSDKALADALAAVFAVEGDVGG